VNRRRRALLLAGLALLLGGLAASDVASRESALREQLGPAVGVVVARTDLAPGDRLTREALAVREVPERYAPRGAVGDPAALVGMRVRAGVAAGQELLPALVGGDEDARSPGPPVRAGERVAEVVAAAPAGQVVPGARVDVLVTRDERPGSTGRRRGPRGRRRARRGGAGHRPRGGVAAGHPAAGGVPGGGAGVRARAAAAAPRGRRSGTRQNGPVGRRDARRT
jgi:Flp pilus assembly protein CpaB